MAGRGRARRYLLTKQGYYPGVVASMGYDVWDWSTLNKNTMFQDSTKLIATKDQSDPVGCWVDYVKKTDATQLSTPNKPGLDLASLNGLPTLSFDGGDLLATGNISISTFAVWVVFKTASTGTIYNQYSSTTTIGSLSNSGGQPAGRISAGVTRGAIVSNRQALTNWATDNTYRIVRHEFNGTHATNLLYTNNTPVSLNDFAVGDPGTGNETAPLYIGALGRPTPIQYMTGNVAHLSIISPYPTDTSILTNMESYINNLWNGVY